MNSAPHFFEADSALVSRQSPAKHSQASEMCKDLVRAPTANTTARQSGHLSGEDLLSSENNSLATPPGWIGTNLQSFFGTGQEKDDDEEGLDPLSKEFPFTQPNQNYCQVVKVLDQLEFLGCLEAPRSDHPLKSFQSVEIGAALLEVSLEHQLSRELLAQHNSPSKN